MTESGERTRKASDLRRVLRAFGSRRDENGAALITVLLLVAVMSAVAVTVLQNINLARHRTANAETVAQARWYALGAETLARTRLANALRASGGQLDLAQWNGRDLVLPIDHGRLTARIRDRGACFNVNSVALGEAGEPIPSSEGIAQFAALLQALGSSEFEAQRLAATLADWIDANNEVNRFGAEDANYALRRPAYRTGGTLLTEETELRAVLGFTPEIYARLRPHVCARPETGPTQINVNALTLDDAPQLSAVFSGALSLEAAKAAIAARPERGWRDIAAFLAEPRIRAASETLGEPPLQQLALRSQYFELEADVNYAEAEAVLSARLNVDVDGTARVFARRWSLPE